MVKLKKVEDYIDFAKCIITKIEDFFITKNNFII